MTIFVIFVAIGVVANLYIFYCVTRECWKSRRKSGVVERIPASLSNTFSIREYREHSAKTRSERMA